MNSNNNYLMLSILNLVHNLIEEGKIKSLQEMGFTIEQLNRIKKLSYSQILFIANSKIVFIDLRINPLILDSILNRAEEHEENSRTIDKAIELGASIEILNKFFGLSILDVSNSRKLKNLIVTKGRVRRPTEQEKELIWEKWKSLKNNNNLNDSELFKIFMDITQHLSMLNSNEKDPLTLTAVINELEPLIRSKSSST